MKKIVLLLLLAQFCFGQSQVYELPRTSTLGDSISVLLLEIYNSASDSFKTRGITFADFKTIMGDSLKRDSLFSEISFTAAFNARLDSFFPHPDSSHLTSPTKVRNWYPVHQLYLREGTAKIDSLLFLGGRMNYTVPYDNHDERLIVSDSTYDAYNHFTYYGYTEPSSYWTRKDVASFTQIAKPVQNYADDMWVGGVQINVFASDSSKDAIDVMQGLGVETVNRNPFGVYQINNVYSSVLNLAPINNIKGAWYSSQNADSLSGFAYGAQYNVANIVNLSGKTFYPYMESAAGIRVKVDNLNYYNDGNKVVTTNNASGGYFWINNQSSGDSAIINDAKGLDFVFKNQGANAYTKMATMLNIQTPVNTGRVDSLVGLKINEQTAGDMGGSWAAYIEGPKSYIEDLRTDTLTVSDSINTAKLHISDIATYTSDRDITDLYHLTDKRYVDEAVTALGARYYMLDNASGEADYKSCSTTVSTGGEQSVSGEDLANDDYVQGWIAPNVNEPDKLLLGVYNWRIYAEKTGGTKTLRLYWKLVERKNDDSEVVIATSVVSNEVVSGKNSYIIPLNLATDYDIASDSYVVGKIYADVSGGGSAPDITLYYEGSSHSHWQIPVNTEILDNLYVKKAGDTMTGTLNLPSDGLAVGDSVVTESDVASWDAAADSTGQDVRSTASPTFGGLTMDGNVNLNGHYLSGDGDSEGVYVNSAGNVGIGTTEPSDFFDVIYDTSSGNRHFKTYGTGGVRLQRTGDETGWAYEYGFLSNNGTDLGGFGALGNNTSVVRYYVGSYNQEKLIIKSNGDVGIGTTVTDSGRVIIADDNPWAFVLGDKSSTPWSAIKVGDASFTTSSDSTKKRDIKRKIAKGDTTVLSRLLDMPEADWYWDGAKIKRNKFDPERHYGGEWDSLSVTKQDSIRAAWIARREARIAKIAERKRFGPMAQDVAEALGPEAGDGESINWDRVNSEYRQAVQELIVIVRKQQAQIDDLKKRVAKLEKKR